MLPSILSGKREAITMHLARFKEGGNVKFERSLQIPASERIPALIKEEHGQLNVLTAIVASLKSALDNINLKKTLNEDQVIELAEVIIDQSHEDNLALEDVLLFLNRLVTGKAGTMYDRLDMPTFFELFETYREERHQACRHFREEQHANYTVNRAGSRNSDQFREAEDEFKAALNDYYRKHYNEESKPV